MPVPNTLTILVGLGLGFYSALGILEVAVLYKTFVLDRKRSIMPFPGRKCSVQRFFHTCFCAFLLARLAWLVLTFWTTEEHILIFALNRFACCLFVSAFSMICFYWAESTPHVSHMTPAKPLSLPLAPHRLYGYIGINIFVYVLQAVLFILFIDEHVVTESRVHSGTPLFRANQLFDAALFFVGSLGFAYFGHRLYIKLATQVASVATTFVMAFLLRAGYFAYYGLYEGREDAPRLSTRFLLGYYVPEVVVAMVELSVIMIAKQREKLDWDFLEALYAEDDDDVAEYYFAAQPILDDHLAAPFVSTQEVVVTGANPTVLGPIPLCFEPLFAPQSASLNGAPSNFQAKGLFADTQKGSARPYNLQATGLFEEKR